MDITFNCPNCKQEMVVDAEDAGREVECPSCGESITIPEEITEEEEAAATEETGEKEAEATGQATEEPARQEASAARSMNPIASSAAAKEAKHYAVPSHEAPSEVLISKPSKPLEVAAKESDKKLRIRTIRHTDCAEVGKDMFDQRVTEFLTQVGENNVISINTIAYTHVDLGSHQLMTDFGVLIVFKG